MSRSETVWIVDDDRSIRWVLEKALQQEGMTTQSFDSADGVMSRLARQQPGFLGVESARGDDGLGVTVSYWTDEAAILAWKQQAEHTEVREQGRAHWYQAFATRVCKVERDYSFNAL
ncbi:antibiotic biosynthesis monooxygenase [Pseudomonas syringae pv. actinidiae]|nr:antibiotic biosynthesis monooxygenase [Pseudomonas syringae pv. actinidiae]